MAGSWKWKAVRHARIFTMEMKKILLPTLTIFWSFYDFYSFFFKFFATMTHTFRLKSKPKVQLVRYMSILISQKWPPVGQCQLFDEVIECLFPLYLLHRFGQSHQCNRKGESTTTSMKVINFYIAFGNLTIRNLGILSEI